MKRHLIKLVTVITLVAIVGALVFTGCAKEEAPPVEEEAPPVEEEAPPVEEEAPPVEEEAPPVAEEWQWPEKLPLVAASFGVHKMASWSAVLAQDTGMTVRIVDETLITLRFKWLAQGRFVYFADLGPPIFRMLEATGENAERDGGPFQVRFVWGDSIGNKGWIVRGDSDIKTFSDIKPGIRFVDWAFAPVVLEGVKAIAAWRGLDYDDDIELVPAGSIGAVLRLILDGKADITPFWPNLPQAYEAAASPHGIRWISLPVEEDPEGAQRYLNIRPMESFGKLTLGVPEAHGIWGVVGLAPIMTRAETDPELAYRTAKWLDENYDRYKDAFEGNKVMTIDLVMELLAKHVVPPHDGLIKYLKEKGLWTAAHDARTEQNIELITRYIEAYQEAIDMADDQDIEVHPSNEEWLELWENYKQKLNLPVLKMFLGLEE